MTEIEAIIGDITKLEVDATVNSANKSLLRGGGVDGAIHRAAGKELEAECITLGGCPTGQSKITKGYNFPCKYVIHSVGPRWYDGNHNERELLRSAYKTALETAKEYGIKTIAFPSISCGIYHFPPEKACQIALNTISDFIKENPDVLEKIYLVDIRDEIVEIYKKILGD